MNLRTCTDVENKHNLSKHKDNKSGYKGVCWHKVAKKWQAYINNNGKRIHLGLFIDLFDAAHAYDKAACDLFGLFARLNFPK